ncbi:MAG TPA: sigma-70 family RNA polymerase sigma factor [Actinomycetota bacterium]
MAVPSIEDARDRDLVRQVRSGDEEAFRALFRRYGPLAKGLAYKVVRQPFMAEEIVQEAFLALWRDPGSYREDRGSFRAWLLAAVHHRAVDMVRREEAQRRRGQEQQAEAYEEDFADSVADRVDLAETKERVRGALEDIPAAQRQILELMYFEGKSQSEIADALGLPLGTVKSRTLLGMRRLRLVLGGER